MADTPRYSSVAEVKSLLQKTGSESDAALAMVLVSAEDAIDRILNCPDGFLADTTASARTYPGSGKPHQRIDDCIEITTVEVKDSPSDTTYVAWASTDWVAFTGSNRWPDFNGLPYEAIMVTASGDYRRFQSGEFRHMRGFRPEPESFFQVPMVRVTAKWGYSVVVPNPIRMAAAAQAERWWKKGQGAFQDSLAPADFGTMRFMKTLDPDIEIMLLGSRYWRPAIGRR